MKRFFIVVLLLVFGLSATQLRALVPGTVQPLMLQKLACTGGTITSSGGKTIHTFTTSGTLSCQGSGSLQYMVAAAGGSGGCGRAGVGNGAGGGGAGGTLTGTADVAATDFVVTIGAKGAQCTIGTTDGNAASGGNSSVTNLGLATLVGGGGGANDKVSGSGAGATGGSGSGGSNSGAGGAATSGQGNAGATAAASRGGGGGGQSAAGSGINAGAGLTSTISGSSVNYSCGGPGGDIGAWGTTCSSPSYGSGGKGAQTTGTGQGDQGQDGVAIFSY
jgi:hypothetical protein